MDQELLERIDLIERMVLAGRRSTQYWGWCLALWGSGQLIAAAWATFGHRPRLAWGVTMAACGVITGIVVAVRRSRAHSESVVSRAIGSVWLCMGISLTLLGFLGNPAGIFDARSFEVVFFSLMGLTYVASGLILEWHVQTGIGVLWWAGAVAAIYGPGWLISWLFLGMVLVGEVILGIYLMIREKVDSRNAGAA
jgi:hypothetical protein